MRILLADDAALLREGLAGLLAAAGHEVVAQVADADALRTEVARLAAAGELPDVVVTDVRMPPTRTDDGLRAAVDLRAAHPGLPVVVLSAYVAGPYLGELIEGVDGAVGYLLKERVGRVSDFMPRKPTSAVGSSRVMPSSMPRPALRIGTTMGRGSARRRQRASATGVVISTSSVRTSRVAS